MNATLQREDTELLSAVNAELHWNPGSVTSYMTLGRLLVLSEPVSSPANGDNNG